MSLRKPSSPPILYLALINHYETSRHMSAQAVKKVSTAQGRPFFFFTDRSRYSVIHDLVVFLLQSLNVRSWRSPKHSGVFAAELGGTPVSDPESEVCGVRRFS